MIGFLTSFGNKLLKSGSSLRSLLVVNSFMCSLETKSSWWFFLGLGGCVGFSLLCSLGIGTCFFVVVVVTVVVVVVRLWSLV